MATPLRPTEAGTSLKNPENNPYIALYDGYLTWRGIAAAQAAAQRGGDSGFLRDIYWQGQQGEEARRQVASLSKLYPGSGLKLHLGSDLKPYLAPKHLEPSVVDLGTLLRELNRQKPRNPQEFVTRLQEFHVPIITEEQLLKNANVQGLSPKDRQTYLEALRKHYKTLGYAIVELADVEKILKLGTFRDKERLRNHLEKLGIKSPSFVDSSNAYYLMPNIVPSQVIRPPNRG